MQLLLTRNAAIAHVLFNGDVTVVICVFLVKDACGFFQDDFVFDLTEPSKELAAIQLAVFVRVDTLNQLPMKPRGGGGEREGS